VPSDTVLQLACPLLKWSSGDGHLNTSGLEEYNQGGYQTVNKADIMSSHCITGEEGPVPEYSGDENAIEIEYMSEGWEAFIYIIDVNAHTDLATFQLM